MPKVKSIKVHHNTSLKEDAIEKLVDADLTGKPLASLKNGRCLQSNVENRKLIRNVLVPDDYPDTDEDWNKDVVQFLRIAVWKGTKRLSDNGMDEMPAYNLPVSTGILIDKIQIMTGQPTSMSLQIHTKVSREDLESRYKQMKDTKAQVIDAQKVEDGAK